MSYVALDVATFTGVACWSPEQSAPALMTVRLPSDPEEVGRPCEKLRLALADLHTIEPITHLFYEATILPGRTTAATVYKLCALAGLAEWFAYRVNATCRRVEQQSWRRHFTGRGTGPSAEMKRLAIEAAKIRGWNPTDDHQADASGVLDYGLHCFGVRTPWRDAHLFAGRIAS